MAFIRRVDVPGASQAHGPISRCLGGPLMIEIVSSSKTIASSASQAVNLLGAILRMVGRLLWFLGTFLMGPLVQAAFPLCCRQPEGRLHWLFLVVLRPSGASPSRPCSGCG